MTRQLIYPTGVSINIDPKIIKEKEIVEIRFSYDPDSVLILGFNPQSAKDFIVEIEKAMTLLEGMKEVQKSNP
jgi:hypothetical protein